MTIKARARDGRYSFDGDMTRACSCGHKLGVHAGAAPHPCFNNDLGDGVECACSKFKLIRKGSSK